MVGILIDYTLSLRKGNLTLFEPFKFLINHCLDDLGAPFFHPVTIDKYGRRAGNTGLFTQLHVTCHTLTCLRSLAVTVEGRQVKAKLCGKSLIALGVQGLMIFVELIMVLPEFALIMGGNRSLSSILSFFMKT